MQPHRQFFTSLKHLEKRLKLETTHPSPHFAVPPPPPPPITELTTTTTTTQQSDSLSTPIYLNSTPTTTNPSIVQESEAPNEFLSTPSASPHQSQTEFSRAVDLAGKSSLDYDVEELMQLLGLNEGDEGDDVGCDQGFYGKIVGVKGPKSSKEVGRLNGWIEYFLKGEKKEPLGLAHLLLGKAAAYVHSGDDGFVFPSTVDEFLINDPPLD
ncbi:hypothetical protein CASFOL_014436 [Castilleja foliolosa]|uniref:Uncharacterized protein n=1 Tax=Castilleja foliolosa TaxID=1961234 RepID=A0ABD3DPL2_9LAMI